MGLFDWGKRGKSKGTPDILHFKGAAEAFDYACKFMTEEIKEKQALAALVVHSAAADDTVQMYINALNAKREENIFDAYRVQVSATGGGFPATALCYKKGKNLQPGDLVYWVPMDIDPMLSMFGNDKRSAWTGGIVAKLEPSFSMRDGWIISEKYA